MTEVLAQLTNTTLGLVVVAVVAVGANVVIGMKVLNRLNTDPADERHPGPLADPAEAREGGGSFQTNVATPRARKIQPVRSSAETALETGRPSSPVDVPIPADSLALVDKPLPSSTGTPKPAGPGRLTTPSPLEKDLPEPVLASSAETRKDAAPPGALILNATEAGVKANEPAPMASIASSEPKADLIASTKPATPATTLPPLATNDPARVSGPLPDKLTEVPTPGRKFFGPAVPSGALTASVTPPPAEKAPATPADKESPGLPPRWSVVSAPASGAKPPETAPSVSLPPLAEVVPSLEKLVEGPATREPALPSAGLTALPPTETPDAPAMLTAPKVEPTGDGLIAVGEPVKLASGGTDVPPVLAGETDDVKKKTPRTPAPEPPACAGLILIPPVEPKPEPATAKAAAPAEPVAKTEGEPAAEKTPAEPVPAPAAAESAPAAKPEGEAKKGPRVFLPGRFFGGSKGKEKEVAAKAPEKPAEPVVPAVEAKAEPELPPITTPPSAPALVVPPVEEVAAVPEAKDEKPPVTEPEPKAAEPVAAKAEEPVTETKAAPEAKAAEPAVETPEAKADAKPEPEPVVPSLPAGKAPEPTTPVAAAAPAEPPKLPAQVAPTTEPIAEPIVPVIVPTELVRPSEALVELKSETPAAPPEPLTPVPVATFTQPQPAMPPTDTTTSLPNNGRASAQLTLGFEITSLQLTPFFKLGSVQLKALSNVVSLHLVAAQADNPLAAGISFQIEHVELDGAAHLKSLLLKPLGESRAVTAPLPKLQVDNVAVTTGGGDGGAPISITTSEQTSTAVQLFGTFTIAAMDFTPAFEIGSLRLEPTSNTVLLRVAPSSRPTALDLPPSFEIAQVQLGDGAQIAGVRVVPSGAK